MPIKTSESAPWNVYMLRCVDETLYTGITKNLDRRLAEHDSGKGAKYTRGRGPHQLIYVEPCTDRSSATKREREIKTLSRDQKMALVEEVPSKSQFNSGF